MDEANWQVAIPLIKFLTIPVCPPRWKPYDLYIFRNEQVAFYAGQSYCAFERVWDHLKAGQHAHSIIGRFVLCNWPRSGAFIIELLTSQAPRFAPLRNDLDAAERALIEELTPCFNVSLNREPAPLPAEYRLPNQLPRENNFRRMLNQARLAERAAARKQNNDTEWE